MFGPLLPALAAGHTVIVPDLQGHGRTADIDRPIDIQFMGDDIAALITHLGLDRPDVMGYSLGGGVAFQTAIRHPELVGRLIMVSTNLRRSAIYADMLGQQGQLNAAAAEFMKDTPMYQGYVRVAPRPEDFPRLLDKMGASMAQDFDYSARVRGPHGPDALRQRRRGHVPAEPRGRGVRAARRRPARWWLDGRGPARRRTRARDHPGPHPLRHLHVPGPGRGGDRVPGQAAGVGRVRRRARNGPVSHPGSA